MNKKRAEFVYNQPANEKKIRFFEHEYQARWWARYTPGNFLVSFDEDRNKWVVQSGDK